MMAMNFENFLEQGASTFEDTVQELQRTYDEVVLGIERPPSYIEKITTSEEKHSWTLPMKKKKQVGNNRNKNMIPRSPSVGHGDRISPTRDMGSSSSLYRRVQSTPTTVDDSSWGDNSSLSYPGNESTSLCCESDLARTKQRSHKKILSSLERLEQKGRYGTGAANTGGGNKAKEDAKKKKQNRLEQKIKSNKPTDSFDEFFGYSTKQTGDFSFLEHLSSKLLLVSVGLNPHHPGIK